jgi:hypothetical protein
MTAVALLGCPVVDKSPVDLPDSDSDSDADTDADSDADTDADSDADSDTDSDTDTDTDTGPTTLLDSTVDTADSAVATDTANDDSSELGDTADSDAPTVDSYSSSDTAPDVELIDTWHTGAGTDTGDTGIEVPLVLTCPSVGDVVVAGSMDAAAIDEASGLVASRVHDVFWVHNDSGDSARVFALDATGKLLATVSLQGASARDWEDMSMGPGPSEGDWLYMADIGDNSVSNSNVHIFRMPEPAVSDAAVTNWEQLTWTYEDGPHNAEGMFVDPLTGDAYVVTKTTGTAQLYQAEAPLATGQVLKKVGPVALSPKITAADISADGAYIGMRTYDDARIWLRQHGASVADAVATTPCVAKLTYEPQGETFAFLPDRSSYATVSEGAYSKLHFFDLTSN